MNVGSASASTFPWLPVPLSDEEQGEDSRFLFVCRLPSPAESQRSLALSLCVCVCVSLYCRDASQTFKIQKHTHVYLRALETLQL